MSVDILETNCDQCRTMVQYSLKSTETIRLVRTESPRWPPQLSHSSWALLGNESEKKRTYSRQPSIKTGQAQVQPARKETLNSRYLDLCTHNAHCGIFRSWNIPFSTPRIRNEGEAQGMSYAFCIVEYFTNDSQIPKHRIQGHWQWDEWDNSTLLHC